MSVTDVKVDLNNDIIPLIRGGDSFSRDITSPSVPNEYSLQVMAYDETGNVAHATSAQFPTLNLTVKKWKTPKTDWISKDRFNIHDYNRIKNNLEFIHEQAGILGFLFIIEEMGVDKESYEFYFYADEFNLFEENLDVINRFIFAQDIGRKKEFFEEAPFIDYLELNRIESAVLNIMGILSRIEAGLTRLNFRFGNMKGVKI